MCAKTKAALLSGNSCRRCWRIVIIREFQSRNTIYHRHCSILLTAPLSLQNAALAVDPRLCLSQPVSPSYRASRAAVHGLTDWILLLDSHIHGFLTLNSCRSVRHFRAFLFFLRTADYKCKFINKTNERWAALRLTLKFDISRWSLII